MKAVKTHAPQQTTVTFRLGTRRDILDQYLDNHFDAVACDPPYDLTAVKRGGAGAASRNSQHPGGRAMIRKGNGGVRAAGGKDWDDTGIAFDREFWAKVFRVLKPGGHVRAFGGTWTYHRMGCALEDVGSEVPDCMMWVFGSGFPKSLNVPKALAAKLPGDPGHPAARGGTPQTGTWAGWGRALKPAYEPIVVCRKPLIGSVAANITRHGTGAINSDGCPVTQQQPGTTVGATRVRRWPANLLHDGSAEVLEAFAAVGANRNQAGRPKQGASVPGDRNGERHPKDRQPRGPGNAETPAQFFYCAKASKADRGVGNNHPTVKPQTLMRWLVRLVTPPGGLILDPFMGSGSTANAGQAEGVACVGIEPDEAYLNIARRRLGLGRKSRAVERAALAVARSRHRSSR
jgi:DNA modification methylase